MLLYQLSVCLAAFPHHPITHFIVISRPFLILILKSIFNLKFLSIYYFAEVAFYSKVWKLLGHASLLLKKKINLYFNNSLRNFKLSLLEKHYAILCLMNCVEMSCT